jgi:uncharacterized surface protein with fasciclin (FAS1) repeats
LADGSANRNRTITQRFGNVAERIRKLDDKSIHWHEHHPYGSASRIPGTVNTPLEEPLMRTRTPAALAIVGALALAACGSDDASNSSADTVTVTTEAMAEEEKPVTTEAMAEEEKPVTTEAMAEEDPSAMAEDEMASAEGDVVVVASGRDDLSTLVAAIQAAGLAETLAGDGPFTIFAPSNQAFEDYFGEMGMTVDDALADPAALATLLQNHVVAGADGSSMVSEMADNSFVSLTGNDLPVTIDGDTITIGAATIVEADIYATNGVIHVIDTVLAPG